MALSAAQRESLERKLRAAWLAGAIEEWGRLNGRPPTDEELRRILRRYDSFRLDEPMR
jgi:hypothetical protein